MHVIRTVHFQKRLIKLFCYQDTVHDVLPHLKLPQKAARSGDEVPVLITAVEDRLGALVAAMNSVYHNSKANVVFYIVTTNDTVDHLK